MAIIDDIQNFVECKEEDGKLYIMVYPDTNKEVLMQAFVEAYRPILNGDLELVRSVIDKASGQWECIGDTPQEYDKDLDSLIIVKVTQMRAVMGITLEAVPKKLTVDKLLSRLKVVGVVFGIKKDVLQKMLDNKQWEQQIVVAEGIPPIEGKDGSIEMKVRTEKSSQPKQNEDGSVDFREIESFTTVNKGDIIATRILADYGTPGTDVLGNEVPPKPRKEYQLKPAQFISVSEDEMHLLADTTGVLVNKNGVLSIKERLELKFVNYDTGNVRFPGIIEIEGGVAAGFSVESDSDIIIGGMVESATVKSTGGSIRINGGITGKGSALISAKKSIAINFAQDANFECIDGDVNVASYMRHCEVLCKNFLTLNEKSSIIGGKIEASESIIVSNSSNSEGTATELTLYNQMEKELLSKRQKLEDVRKPLEQLYKNLEFALKTKTTALKTFGFQPGTPQYDEYLTVKKKFEEIKEKSELVENNIKAINAKLSEDSNHTGTITITKSGYLGTVLKIGKYVYELKNDVLARRYRLENAEIVGGPITKDTKPKKEEKKEEDEAPKNAEQIPNGLRASYED